MKIMNRLKHQLKRVVSSAGCLFPMSTALQPDEACKILQQYSPKPTGRCTGNNEVDIRYDLQIIVPAFNEEKYIRQCIDSTLNQRTDYKVLVSIINDGSTDGTLEIIDEYMQNYTHNALHNGGVTLELISQENKGLSGARNAGMRVIKGTYLAFLDSDDVIVDGAIQKMLDAAFMYDAEILQGSWYTFTEAQSKEHTNDSIRRMENHIVSEEGVLKDNRGVFSGLACGKLYKYNVIEHFLFPEGFLFEDTPVSFIIAAMPYRCVAIKDIVYGYRKNPAGITATSRKQKRAVDSYWITEKCLEEFQEFELKYDQRAYEYLLRQSLMNKVRTKQLPYWVQKAEFVLTSELMERYFEDFKTNDCRMREIEKALRKRQFIKFELLSLM